MKMLKTNDIAAAIAIPILFFFGTMYRYNKSNKAPHPQKSAVVVVDTAEADTIKLSTRISVYNPSRSNTSGDTLLTASGARINPQHPQRWLAVQQSWLKYFPYGSKVYVNCPDAPYINGEWEVKDTGCANGIDLLISNPIVCRIEFCLQGYVSNKPIN